MVFGWLRKPSLQQTAKAIILEEMLREEVRTFINPPRRIHRPPVRYTRYRRFAAVKNGHTKIVGEEIEFG